ncbi:RHS repeat-associated core domain-containing protein, partial [Sedimentibacter saalensis]
EWGEITHNAVLKCGQRELDLVKRYATHDYDSVLSMYYAKARFYDAQNRRFASTDPILDASKYDIRNYLDTPVQFTQYIYVNDNAITWIDSTGEVAAAAVATAAEGLVVAAVAATAVYLTTPEGQDAIKQLSELLGASIQSFVSSAKGFLDQVDEAIEYFYQVQCVIVENVQKKVDEAVKSDNPNKEWNKNTVYVHYDTVTGKVYYVGRTKDFDRRYREHAKKVLGFYVSKHPIGKDVNRDMIPVVTGLTSTQSKIVEQILI